MACGQMLTFCSVNAHCQNGVAKRRIREFQDHACTMLIHANKRWPHAINTHLWPYALHMVNDILNATLNLTTSDTPLNAFVQSDITYNPKHWYPFGCPVYVLDSDLQAGKKISKWSDRARMGIYLGPATCMHSHPSLVSVNRTSIITEDGTKKSQWG